MINYRTNTGGVPSRARNRRPPRPHPASGATRGKQRFITVDEHAVLQELATRGPTRQLSARLSGRLSLYGLIDEGPRGWAITAEGRKMLRSGRIAPRAPQDLLLSMRPVLATAENMAWTEEAAELAA